MPGVAVQALALVTVALVVRGLHFWEMSHSVLYELLLGDAGQYDRWAQSIAGGDWIGSEVFYQTPLYPYLLGALYRVFGHDPWLVRVLQAGFGALSCVFLARAGAGFFSERVGWWAGVLLALYPPAIFFDGILQKASLDLLLMTALLWLLSRARNPLGVGGSFGAGIVLGAMTLNRENAAALLPVLIAWIVWRSWPQGAARSAMLCAALGLGAATLLLPVGLRNRWVGGELLLTTSQMGSNFYLGNHRGADGGYTPLRAGRGDATFERDDARLLAEDDLKRPLGPREVSRYWFGRAWADIGRAPSEWMQLLAWKWLLTWNRLELVDAEAIGTHERESVPLATLGAALHFGVLCPLAALGAWWTRREWRRLWLLYAMALTFAAAVTGFYVFARYRYPLVPVAALFAGAGLDGLVWQRARAEGRRARDLVVGLALAAAAAVFCNWPIRQLYADDAVTYYNAGTALLERGRTEEAVGLFERARTADPDFPETYSNLGQAWMRLQRPDDARRALERGIALAPRHAIAHYNLAVVVSQQNDLARTRSLLARAIELDPLLARAYGPLAELELRSGDLQAGVAHLRRAAELEPGLAIAHADLGLGLLLQGNPGEAVDSLRTALRLDPGLLPVRNRLAWTLATTTDPAVRDGAAALALAEAACPGADCTNTELLRTRAAALAAAGRFGEAEGVATRAGTLARAGGEAALAERIERERGVYSSGQALREPPVTAQAR